jgi:tetratricopeptide (TPR) repeat protein
MGALLSVRRACIAWVLLLAAGTVPSAQQGGGKPAAPTSSPAARALNAGQFEEVERLLKGATDPASIALRARAQIAQGHYQEAQTLLTPAASAQPDSDAALELGLLELYLGKRADGIRRLRVLTGRLSPRSARDFFRLAQAASALATFQDAQAFKDANSYFRDANKLAPNDPDINAAWGELFLDKHNPADAMKSFQEALRVDDSHVGALIGAAEVNTGMNPPAARAALERALKINANSVPALLLQAELALDDRERDRARESIKKALAVNPNSLEARSLDAAIARLEDKAAEFDRLAQDVLKINPGYGEVYRVAGDHLARNYRFDEAVTLVRRALTLDADNTRAYSDLGTHLLRTGDEPGARVALERAFKGDAFDQTTFNQLDLLDTIDKFVTITDGDIIMRLDPAEVGVMREYAMPLAKEALGTLQKLYDFKVTGPILIEMFPKHDQFAVRTIGLPGFIGALGACFGRVVTLDSPNAREPGEFHWGETLWHEIAHVITLQMSKNRLPRWLSEGISVWEERRARPEWGREMDMSFAQAINEDKVLKLKVLNEGFSDPRLISLSYYQASLVVDHIVDTYGEPKLRDLIRSYGEGLETEAAVKESLGVSLDQLQEGFDARLEKQYATLRKSLQTPKVESKPTPDDLKKLAETNPESFAVQMQLAVALHQAKDPKGAIQALERAAKLAPTATGDNNPNKMIAAIAGEMKDEPRQIQALDALLKVDASDVESARQLAKLLDSVKDDRRSEEAYRRVIGIDPFDRDAQTAYGRLALKRKDNDAAVRAFRAALARNPPDRAQAHVDLAEAYVSAGQAAEAKKEILAALEIAPSFEKAQDLLLKIAQP